MANLWSHKGYDIVFKFCVCDCGHGSLKKDLDYVPPRPAPLAPVNNPDPAAPVTADKKKKKKEKANLRPKLNFNPQNVSGTYFGSSRQKEEEEEVVSRHNRILSSSEKSDSGSAPVIPGLSTPTASKPASPALSRSSSKSARKSSLSESPEELEEGWVRVSTSRRGSQSQQDMQPIKPINTTEMFPSLASAPRARTPPLFNAPAPPVSKLSAKVEASLSKAKPVSKSPVLAVATVLQLPPVAPEVPKSPIEVKQLPMFQPPVPDLLYESSTSSLRYQTGIQPPIGSQQGRRTSSSSPGHNLGARPKFSPTLSDEVYPSDEDILLGDWIDPTTIDKEKDMDDLFLQTKQFERNMCLLTPERDKRDSNGFYNCQSCQTVYSTAEEYEAHLRSEKHVWAERLHSDLMSISSLKGGWESISVRPDIWQSPDSYVKGVTPEEFSVFKKELKQFKIQFSQQLEQEKKEKEELSDRYDLMKTKYEEEVEAKEKAEAILTNFKEETLRMTREEKGKFDQQIVKSKEDVLALKEVIDSLTKELRELREEEQTCPDTPSNGEETHSILEKEMKIEIINLTRAKGNLETKCQDLSTKYQESQKMSEELTAMNEVLKSGLVLSESENDKKDKMITNLESDNNTTADRLREELRKKIIAELDVKKLNEKLEAKEDIEKSYVKEIEVLKTGLDKIKNFNEKLELELCSHEKNLAEIGDLKQKLALLNSKEEKIQESHIEIKEIKENIEIPNAKEEVKQRTDVKKNSVKDEKHEHEDEVQERNILFDLFDEVNSQRKKRNAEGEVKETQKELSQIIKDSIKDETLRNCLSSIIDEKSGDGENKEPKPDKEYEKEGPNPYDTLDRFPQPGLDDEIDPYLGEDKPGEFDEYPRGEDGMADESLLDEEQIYEEDEIGSVSSDDEEPEPFNQVHPMSNLKFEKTEDEHLEPEEPKPFNMSGGDLEVNELHVHPGGKKEPIKYCHRIHKDEMEEIQMLGVPIPCIMRAEDDMGKRMEDMTDEELREHMSILAKMTKDDSLDMIPMPLDDPPEDDAGVEFSSRRTSLCSLSSSNSTQNDASSLSSDSLLPGSSSRGQDEASLSSLVRTVASLKSLVHGLTDQVATLSNKMDDSNFEAGLLNKTVEMLQKKNTKLTESVDILESKNDVLEKKFKDAQKSSSNNDVNGLRENFLEILASCEIFQTSFDSMSERQVVLDDKLKTVSDNFDMAATENQALKKDFDGLAKEVSSLKLEFQVDKGQTKRLMDDMAYSLAVLTNNKNSGSGESFSSTSGVKSDDVSDPDDYDKVGSLAFLDLKENLMGPKEDSPKTTGVVDSKDTKVSSTKMKIKMSPAVPAFSPLPSDGGAGAVLHYGGVIPPGVQVPQQGAMPRSSTMMTTRMPIVYQSFNPQIFSHGPGAVSYPSFYYAHAPR